MGVSGSRADRIALNEAAFRVANERMRAWEERHANGADESYFCECARMDCAEKVVLGADEYEHIRTDSRHFLVRPGHETPEVETVIERCGEYFVIEKAPEVEELVRRTDPRND